MKVTFDNKGWPRNIPWPEPGEFCRYDFRDGGKCCLVGWLNTAFGDDCSTDDYDYGEHPKARVFERMRALVNRHPPNFNDDPRTTEEDLARVWAEAWRHFGYEVQL